MIPRAGGEADKVGNRYEAVWTARQLLYVLAGHVTAITVEPFGELSDGAEFILERGTITEAHQVKRQHGSANEWTLGELSRKGVLRSARGHVEAGRQFHFISLIPCQQLEGLAGRARETSELEPFLEYMLTNKDLREGFDYLKGPSGWGSEQTAWAVLRGMYVRWPDERDLRDQNAALANLLLEGAPGLLAMTGLIDLVHNHPGRRLDADALEQLLLEYGLSRAQLIGNASLSDRIGALLASWKAGVGHERLQPPIARDEARQVVDLLKADTRALLITGAAGGGKSAVMYDVVSSFEQLGWRVLPIRLDRTGSCATTIELGERVDLHVSPVTALAAISHGKPSLLVIDQFDAVSLIAGRTPETFDAVASLIREAQAFPEMRVLLACRAFDAANDHRIRSLAKLLPEKPVAVAPLDDTQVKAAVAAMGLAAERLQDRQIGLLRSPLNLVLLTTIADQDDALAFGSGKDLFDAYWQRKYQDCRKGREHAPRFREVIGALAEEMSRRQQLAVPLSVLDKDDLLADAAVLESEHVIVRDGKQLAFFHESFFDYAFARQWISRGESLTAFLRAGDQELFRRGQVRQVLDHLYSEDHDRFLDEVNELLTSADIRFHIKHVVLAVLRSLSSPTERDWRTVEHLIATHPDIESRLCLGLRTAPWVKRLTAIGILPQWLASSDSTQSKRAIEIMTGAIEEGLDDIAGLIEPYAGRHPQFPDWLRWFARFAKVYKSRSFFELILASVRRGEHNGRDRELWTSVYGLGAQQPVWATELLSAFLSERPGAFDVNGSGKIEVLLSTEHALIELIDKAATFAPREFCAALLPYMLRAMSVTEIDATVRPVDDRHFAVELAYGPSPLHKVQGALLDGAARALQALIQQSPKHAEPLLSMLAVDPHESAQCLLYRAVRPFAADYAEQAVAWLMEGEHRFFGGNSWNRVWAARELVQAISPHLSTGAHEQLEQMILGIRAPWDRRGQLWHQFCLLSAFEEARLSAIGQRRLGELQRRFEDAPAAPLGAVVIRTEPPISPAAAAHMTDENWLKAMAKHATDSSPSDALGGADELAGMLQNETAEDPVRFARLSLQLRANFNPAYPRAILLGLTQAKQLAPVSEVLAVIRHLSSLQLTDVDEWLAHPLGRYLDEDVPDDIIELLLSNALNAPATEEDVWLTPSRNGEPFYGGDIHMNGINTGRGRTAEMLGDLLVRDTTGNRTALVAPKLQRLAGDPSVAVRSCVAHLIAASLRHARDEAVSAFEILVRTDDRLLATRPFIMLAVYIANDDVERVAPVIARMLTSNYDDVRQSGGYLAVHAGLQLNRLDLLQMAATSQDAPTKIGMAMAAAGYLPLTNNAQKASELLVSLADDPDEDVRAQVSSVAASLRGHSLRPFASVLTTLIASASFKKALPQLLITLAEARDRIDDLIVQTSRRFIAVFGSTASDASTGAAGEAREVMELVLRAYAQTTDRDTRIVTLGLIDQLLFAEAFGVEELVEAAERGEAW